MIGDDADAMHTAVVAGLTADHFSYTFVHYRNPDTAGHASGWGSDPYEAAVVTVSTYLGDLIDTIESDPVLAANTVLIVTSDHGGTDTGHGASTDEQNFTIPLFTWGAGVSPGADLYALNPDRAVPGDLQIPFDAAAQPIRNGDTGSLALGLLGLPQIDGALMNAGLALHEPVTCGGRVATIFGTDGDDVIEGTGGDDVIHGLGGDDIIRGGPGADVICGGLSDDTLLGGLGRDRIGGGPGHDLVLGGHGADVLVGGGGRDRLRGGSGADLIKGGRSSDVLAGGAGNDRLLGGSQADILRGGPDTDIAFGEVGRDRCRAETVVDCEL